MNLIDLIKKNQITIAAALLCVFTLSNPFAIVPFLQDSGPNWLSLDNSWEMVLNYALINKWTWGKDIIFNYGPLGFLSTRVGLGISKWVFLAFDVFILLNFFMVFKTHLIKTRCNFWANFILIACVFLLNPFYGADLAWLLFFFYLYWMFTTFQKPHWVHFLILTILTAITFLVKLNSGLIVVFFYILHILNLVVFKKINNKQAAVFISFLIVIIGLSCIVFHVAFINYIKGSIEIINGYHSIMYLNEIQVTLENGLEVLYLLMSLLFTYLFVIKIKQKKYAHLFYSVVLLGYLFLLRKQCILRNDLQHIQAFFSFAPILLLLLCFDPITIEIKKKAFNFASLILVFAMLFGLEKNDIGASIYKRISSPVNYVSGFKNYDQLQYLNQQSKKKIPERIIKIIGTKSIDVFPWDSEYILENKLNYQARPVFQSYTAFTSYLQEVNYQKYLQNAPEYILFDYDAIDGRYPLNDEYLIHLFILKNYSVKDTFTSNERFRLLLEKNKSISNIILSNEKLEQQSIANEILVAGADIIKVNLDYNLNGMLHSFFYKPTPISVVYVFNDGTELQFKTSKELLSAGMLSAVFIKNASDFMHVMQQKLALNGIYKIKIEADSTYFKKQISVKKYQTNFKPIILSQNQMNIGIAMNHRNFETSSTAVIDNENVIALWGSEVESKAFKLKQGKYLVKLLMRGDAALGEFPKIKIEMNGKKVFETAPGASYQTFQFNYIQELDQLKVKIKMLNDYYDENTKADRNAFVKSIVFEELPNQ